MSESFEQLDPNYVIAFDYSANNLTHLLTELGAKGLHVLTRPGYDKETVYAFTRVDDRDVHKNVNEKGRITIETSEETGEEILHKICQPLKFVKSIIRIHDFETRKKLDMTSNSLITGLLGLPSDQELVQLEQLTRNSRQALYFAFFKTYIQWLIPLSVVGAFSKLLHISTSWEFNIPYTAFLMIWSLLFASSWVYRSEPFYSAKFGKVQSFSETSEPNLSTPSAVLLKKLCFLPVAALFVLSLVCFQFFCFFVEIFVTQFYAGPLSSILALTPTVMICSFTPILTIIYNRFFVDRLVKWENGPNPIRSKVEKNFVLTFFTSYVPLFITLFIYLPLGYTITPEIRAAIAEWSYKLHIPIGGNDFVIDVNRYRNQFFYFIVTNQVIAFSMENLLPLIQNKLLRLIKNRSKSVKKDSDLLITATVKSYFPRELSIWQKVNSYHVSDFGEFDVDENFRKIIIQFGFLSIFSTIWPLAPLMSLLFSHIMLKADLWRALKKCTPSTNPNDISVSENNCNASPVSADPWDTILSAISWIGATAGPTLLVMYRYCGLPGVGVENTLSKRDYWYRHSPLPYSWTTILLIAIASEHVAVLSFAYFKRLFITSGQKFARGFVPATDLQEPPQVDFTSIVKQTTSFMNVIAGNNETTEPHGSQNDTRSYSDAAIPDLTPNSRGSEKSRPLAGKVSSHCDSSTTQEKRSNGVASPAVVNKANDSEQKISPVSQSRNIVDVASKTSSAGPPAVSASQENKGDAKTTGINALSTSLSSADKVKDKISQSPTKSNQEIISSAAGATLPATIPTSKNYHLRYDSNGNPISAPVSAETSEASLHRTQPDDEDLEQKKKEPSAGVANEMTNSTGERRQSHNIEAENTVASEVRSLDPAKALNTVSHHARDDNQIPSTKKTDADVSLATNAAAAALSSHTRTSSQMNAVQQFGRDVATSIKSTKTAVTSMTDHQKSSLDRANSVKSKTTHSSHTHQSGTPSKTAEGNERKTSTGHRSKEPIKIGKDHKSKRKNNLLHKLKKKL